LFFHSVGNVIIPTDEVIFFRGVGRKTTNQISSPSFYRVTSRKRGSKMQRKKTKVALLGLEIPWRRFFLTNESADGVIFAGAK